MYVRSLALLALASLSALAADPPRAAAARACAACHDPAPGNLLGYLEDVQPKAGHLLVKLDGALQVLRYEPKTLKVLSEEKAATPEAALESLKRGQAVRVEYAERKGVKIATLLSAKPSVKLAATDLVTTEEVERLVALGPEAGRYHLFDARPPERFREGSIPTAVNLPFTEFDRHLAKLPADKGAMLIFFCHGTTCHMSPCALAKARSLGYTQARIYRDGMSAWYAKSYGVIAPTSFKEAYLDREVPAVILDLRPAEDLGKGFIPGSVAVAPPALKELVAHDFPPAHLRPPILVVDGEGGEAARTAALELVRAGYTRVNVLTGGFQAWEAAALGSEKGAPAVKVAYAPRLRPGAIPSDEFAHIAGLAPEARKDILILDVRNRLEARGGMIKGAVNVPHDELEARLSELPRDRRILVHCGTGELAGPACAFLKEKGYRAAYLDAEITIIDTGDFVID